MSSDEGYSLEVERQWTVYRIWRRSLQVRHNMFASSSSGKCAVREMGDVSPNGRKTSCVQSVGRAMEYDTVGGEERACEQIQRWTFTFLPYVPPEGQAVDDRKYVGAQTGPPSTRSLVVYRLVHPPVTRESGVRLPARETLFAVQSNIGLEDLILSRIDS